MGDARNIKIKLDVENLKTATELYRKLAEEGDELNASATSGYKNLQKLMKAVQNGAKITSSEVDEYQAVIKRMNESMDLAINRHDKSITKTKENITSLTREISNLKKQLEKEKENLDRATKASSQESLFKSTVALFNESDASDVKKEAAKVFKDLEEIKKKSKLSLKTSAGKDKSPEEQAEILAAREMIDLYQKIRAEAEKAENVQKEKINETTAALNQKNNALEKNKQVLNSLKNNRSIDFAKGARSSLRITSEELSQAHYDLGRSGSSTAQLAPSKGSAFEASTKGLLKAVNVTQIYKRVLHESIRAIQDLDNALTNMTVVTGESREETAKYVQTFADLAQASSSTMTEIANLTTEYVRQGRTVADSMTLAEETAKAAKIAGISTADALTYMTSAINGFNLEASDAAHVSDVFARVAAETATDFNQLAVALSKVSAQANQAGMSIEYTTALLAKGIETTQEAPESIGTALKTIIARFRELRDYGVTLEDGMNVNKVEAALGAVGIQLRNTTGEFRSLEDVFNELGAQWEDLTSMQRQAIAQAAAGTRQQSRFLAIMQDWERTLEITTISQEAAGAAAAQYAKYAEGMTAAITNLESAWQALINAFAEEEWIISGVQLITGFLSTLANIVDALGPAVPAIALGIVGIVKAFQLLQSWREKELTTLQKEIDLARTKGTLTEKEKQTQKEKAKEMIQNARDELQATKEQEIADKQAAIQERIAEKRRHLEWLANYRDEEYAKSESHTRELKRQLSLTQDETRKAQIQKELSSESGRKGWITRTYKEAAAETQREITSLETQLKEVENNVNKSYEPAFKSLEKLEKDVNGLGVQFGSLADGITQLFSNIGKGTKSVLNDLSQLSKKNGGFKAFSETKTAQGIGIAATGALIMTSITLASTAITEMVNLEKNTMAQIAQLSSANFDLTSNASNVAKLREEYEALSNKVNKTVEEEQRLLEIEEEMKREYGIDVESVKSFSDAIADYNVEIAKNTEESLAEAFRLSIRKGADMWEQADFETLVKVRFSALNEADTSTEQGRFQSQQYEKMVDNYDSATMAGNITDKYKSKTIGNNIVAGAGAGIGGAAVGGAAGVGAALIMAGAVSAIPVVGWIAAGVIAAGTAVFAAWKAIDAASSKNAEKMAQELAEQTVRIANDFNEFSESMAEAYDGALGEQFAKYTSTMERMEGSLDSATRAAIEDTYRGFEIIDKLRLDKEDLDRLQQVIRDESGMVIDVGFSNESVNALIMQAGELGDEAGEAFLKTWTDITETGADASTTAFLLATSLNGSSTEDIKALLMSQGYSAEKATRMASATAGNQNAVVAARNQAEKEKATAEAEKVKAQEALETFRNFGSFKQFLKENKEFKGMTYSEVEAKLQSAVDSASQAFDQAGNAIDNLTDTLLNAISPFEDIQALSQGLTSLDSSMKNTMEFADRLEEGTATLEDWVNASTEYADILSSEEWANATDSERANLIRAQGNIFDTHDKRKAEIDAFENRTIAETQIAIDEIEDDESLTREEKDEQIAGLEATRDATIAALKAMRDMVTTLTGDNLYQVGYDNAIIAADKKIAEGNLEGYSDKIQTVTDDIKRLDSHMETTWDNIKKQAGENYSVKEWRGVMDDMLAGNTKSYEKWAKNASDAEKAAFNTAWEMYSEDVKKYEDALELKESVEEEFLNKKIELQNEAVEVMQAKLEEEYEATKESLEKRKELYDKYFDAIDQEAEESDYEEERQKLLNRIASLSTATDSESLSKLREAQEELGELDSEYLQSERDARREAVEESFENREESLEKSYNDAMENVQSLWEEFIKMQEEDQKELFLEYGKEFKNVTDLALEVATKALNSKIPMFGKFGPAYANGGLVNYTGPAWVDGTRSRPEAFLDAVDTANIASLALGLRAIAANNITTTSSTDNGSTFTIESLNITVNGGADGQQAGRAAADGFIKAIQELGVNINKQG